MRTRLIGVVIAAALTLTACGSDDHEYEHDSHGGHQPMGETAATPMPYGEGYEHLHNRPPESVAEAALLRLTQATSTEVDDGSAIERVNGVTTPALWSALSADPARVLPSMTGPEWRAWDTAGGQARAEVAESPEQHPKDTPTSWTRKYGVTKQLDGRTKPLHETYIVSLEQFSGQWRVSDLRQLSGGISR